MSEENGQYEDGGALRQQLEQALAKVKEAEARAAAAETLVADSRLSTFLSGKNADPKAAKYIKLEKVDVTDDSALDKWLADNPEWIRAAPQADTTPTPDITTAPEEVVAAWQAMQAGRSVSGDVPPDLAGRVLQVDRTLSDDASSKDVWEAYAKAFG